MDSEVWKTAPFNHFRESQRVYWFAIAVELELQQIELRSGTRYASGPLKFSRTSGEMALLIWNNRSCSLGVAGNVAAILAGVIYSGADSRMGFTRAPA